MVATAPGKPFCLVTALKLFEQSPRTGETPLFKDPDGTVMHHGQFIATLRIALLATGFNASLYAGWPQLPPRRRLFRSSRGLLRL